MTAIIDTNVILDVLTARQPFFNDSLEVLNQAERGRFVGLICATTITTIFYLGRRHLGTETTLRRIEDLIGICSVAPVNRSIIDAALKSPGKDFEDAVLLQAGITSGANCIITRNQNDFPQAQLLIYTPTQFLDSLK